MRKPWLSKAAAADDAAASQSQRGLSLALALVVLVTVAVLPVQSTRLSAESSFVPAMLALVGCFDVLVAVFLIRQFLDTGDRVPLRLSWAYIFSLVVMAGYAAAFPNVLGAHPPLSEYPSTSSWLWVAWHTGFPVLLAVALARRSGEHRSMTSPVEVRVRHTWISILACVVGGGICILVAGPLGGHLPVIIHGDNTSAMSRIAGPVMLPVVAVAALLTWLGSRTRRGPERWAAIAAAASLGDVVLTLASRYRYSAGWYAGRSLTIIASAAVLVALLIEFGKVKTELAEEGERLSASLRRAGELERLQQTLLDNMVDGVTLRSQDGELIAFNLAAPQLLGLTVDQMTGLAAPDDQWRVFRPNGRDWTPTDNPGVDTIRTGVECHDEMLGVASQDGTVRWLRANTVIVKGEEGATEGVVTTYADVTDSHAEEVRLAKEQQAKRRRIAAVLDGSDDCLRIVFQPIVELASGEVVGYEALSRFHSSPTRPPNEWFADAAAVGLGVEMELHALRVALAERHRMPEGAYLSLNISPQTAMSAKLLEVLATAPCEHIVLEITEHVGIEDYEALADSLERLRATGLRIAIDDMGSGYASLRHILNLRPDIIKLDIALTRGIDEDPARQALAIALVSFREEIEAVLVAEGIETQSELEILIQLGLQHGQGYHLGKPGDLPELVVPDDVATVLSEQLAGQK
ncbi:MAG TPA: EAL domain-containing protein [Acidimicrobiales bacterium]|jgi:PAS domain S-box-containing protein|nr:EAL domain-containing protein [Acidimicrobiales bacterium]